MTIQEQIKLVKENWLNISKIENPCFEAQIEALNQDSRARLLITDLDPNILTIHLSKKLLDTHMVLFK